MKQEFVEKMLTSLFPKSKLKIVSYTLMDRQQLNESGEWVKDTPAIFIDITFPEDSETNEVLKDLYLTDYLSNMTGFEFAVTKV